MTNIWKNSVFMSEKKTRRIALYSIAVLLLLAYLPVGTFDFVFFDDDDYVFRNNWVQKGITWESVKWAFTTFHSANWHPITWLSHMLDIQMFGLVPGLMHMVNLLIHVANAYVLFLFLRLATQDFWKSYWVAILFGLHPLHVESVAWVSERKDLLCALFYLATLYAYTAYAKKPGIKRYIWVLAAFVAGLLSKPMIVTLPFLLLLLDVWPLKRVKMTTAGLFPRPAGPWSVLRNLILEKLPLFMLAVGSSLVTIAAQKSVGAVGTLELYPFWARLGNAVSAYLGYIEKTVWPACLCFFYPHPGMPGAARIAGASLFLGAITVIVVRLVSRHPFFAVGWFWYLGTLVPVIGLVQVGSQAMADRYTYIPQMGLFILVVWGVGLWVKTQQRKKLVLACGAAVICAWFLVTNIQIHYWRDSETMFKRALACTRNNFLAHNNYGAYLAETGRLNEAMSHLVKARAIKPSHVSLFINLGVIYSKLGQHQKAAEYYHKALELQPQNITTLSNLGIAYSEMGNFEQAEIYYKKAIALAPYEVKHHMNLGVLYVQQGQFGQAEAQYRIVLDLNHSHIGALNNLASIMMQKGLLNQAKKLYLAALKINPKMRIAQKNLKILNTKLGIKEAAKKELEQAIEQHPDDPGLHLQMGQVYKIDGDWQKALDHFEKAVNLAPDQPEMVHTLAVALAMRGKYDQALSALNRLEKKGLATPRTHYLLAAVYSRKKDANKALDWLEKAISGGFDPGVPLADDPNFAAIKNLPEFMALAKGLKKENNPAAENPKENGGP